MQSVVMKMPAYFYDDTKIICLQFSAKAENILNECGSFEFGGSVEKLTINHIRDMPVGSIIKTKGQPNVIRNLRRACYDSQALIGGDMIFRLTGAENQTQALLIDVYKLPPNSYYPVIQKELYDTIDGMERDVIYYIGCHEHDTAYLVSYMAELWNKRNKTDYISTPKCTPGGNDHTWQIKKPSEGKRPTAVMFKIEEIKRKQAVKLEALEANMSAAPQVRDWARKSYHSLEAGQSCTLTPSEYTNPLSLRQTVKAFARRKGIELTISFDAEGIATVSRIE